MANKKETTRQTESTPLIHKQILSQFEIVSRSTSRPEEKDREDNDTDDASANFTRVLSPGTLDSRWPRGFGDRHWPQVWDLPKNPTTWTTRDRVPYVPNHSQATLRQKVHIG